MNNIYLHKKINEAVDKEFSYNELDNIKSFRERFNYCTKHLGAGIGQGSSRIVFQIDDEKVLKLAKNTGGLYQNKWEWNFYKNLNGIEILPEVYLCSDDYAYIVSDYVLPAKKKDFYKILGILWYNFEKDILMPVWHVIELDEMYKGYNKKYIGQKNYFEENWPDILNNKFLISINKYDDIIPVSEKAHKHIIKTILSPVVKYCTRIGEMNFLKNLMTYCKAEGVGWADLVGLSNWGISNKNKKLHLVLLDSGWTSETMGAIKKSLDNYNPDEINGVMTRDGEKEWEEIGRNENINDLL